MQPRPGPTASATAPPDPAPVDILSADLVLPVSAPPIRDGAVAIEDGRIVGVGPTADVGTGRRFEGAAILPGLVNAHSHLEYAVYAGFGDGLSFKPWIETHVERKRRISFDDHLAISRLGAAECLASGIATVGDASFTGAAALACADLGLRGIVYLEVFGETAEAGLARFRQLERRAGPAASERVRIGVSPHAPYTCTAEVYAACDALGLPTATHLNESLAELEWLISGAGPFAGARELLVPPAGSSGIRMLAERSLLGPRLVAAHCVEVDQEEIRLLATAGVAVCHCPRSNAFLGCGIAPVGELIEAGVRVGLGTDSPASAPSFDMFEEMRAAVALARLRSRTPEAMPAGRALELATLGSAAALGLADEIGSLEPGKRADLTVVDLEGSPFLPWEEPASAVVLGGSPGRVVTTLVGGEVRYERGASRWHELQQRGHDARSKLLRPSLPSRSATRR